MSDTIQYPQRWAGMNVALAHDWLTGMRGGENVLELLCNGFQSAPIYTLIHNRPSVSAAINRHPLQTSWLNSLPGIYESYRNMLPMFPSAIRSMKLEKTDLLISTSHCVAKGIGRPEGGKHVCYCFTPMRYAWLFHDEYFGRNPAKRILIAPMLSWLRRWDRKSSDGVDHFIAISEHVRQRIQLFYNRDADVVFPPVDTLYYTPESERSGDFDLIVSALVPYKRVDLAVQTYTRMGWPLKIVGIGGDLDKLRELAGPNVEFLQWQSREAIRELYRDCRCLVFPGEEDFGIVPVEAQACGAPVLAFARGGALETVSRDISGIFFEAQTEESLIEGVQRLAARSWDSSAIRAHAESFSAQRFINDLDACLARAFQAPA